MAKPLIVMSLFTMFFTLSAWGDSYYCTNTQRVVSTGATLDQIIQACGNPSKVENTENSEPVARKFLMQWIYLSKQNLAPWDNKIVADLTISLFQDRVESIQVNGKEVQGGINCFGRGMIQPGDLRSKVALICGKPDAHQHNRKTIMGPKETTTRLIYQRAANLPPVIFELKQGSLAEIHYGS
ncbi:MAG: uncharacterized protein K0S11_1797 [Gammaproteobacteria bacterium]|nr:uncharacterized protein [Gammaproteobacteria bacterium]